MNDYLEDKIRIGIKESLEQGRREFVICPFGTYGRVVKKILNDEFGIQEKFCVDSYASDENVNIVTFDDLKKEFIDNKEIIILLAVHPAIWDNSLQIHRRIMKFADFDRVVDLLSWSICYSPWNYFERINCPKKLGKIALIEALSREIYRNKVKGSVAEAGVYRGETAKYINMLFPDRKLYLFDTFSGFDSDEFSKESESGRYALDFDFSGTSEKIVLEKMHYERNCVVRKGWFPDTTQGLEGENFALARLDMDLYEPIKAGLEFFYPRMTKGGYIVIHDCRSKNYEGARVALMEFCKKNNLGYFIMTDVLGSAVINIGL